MKKWFLLLLLLALPATGLATQENTVVVLPTVAPLILPTASPAEEPTITWMDFEFVNEPLVTTAPGMAQSWGDYSSAPVGEYYAVFGTDDENYQNPRLTSEEHTRTIALLEAYRSGKRPEHNVLNKLDNVTVGVYTLRAEDYEGETLFTLLPFDPLTDEEILEIIDAFAQCGKVFNPDKLTYKNCMRGGGIEATRFFQAEEMTRRTALRSSYIRMGFQSAAPYTPLVADDGLGIVTLNADAYSGLDNFLFLPLRPMTDDELLAYEIYTATGDPAEYGNYADYEKRLRQGLKELLGAPLTITLENEKTGVMGDFNVSYDDEKVYYAYFTALNGQRYSGYLNIDTSTVMSARLWLTGTLQYSDLHMDPFDEKWLEIARKTVQSLRSDGGAAIASVESRGETRLQFGGFGVMVVVLMDDGSYYQFEIAYQNWLPVNGINYEAHAPNVERMYTVVELQ